MHDRERPPQDRRRAAQSAAAAGPSRVRPTIGEFRAPPTIRRGAIAALIGRSEQWVSREIQREAPHVAVRLAILDWDTRTPAERWDLLVALGLVRLLYHQPLHGPR